MHERISERRRAVELASRNANAADQGAASVWRLDELEFLLLGALEDIRDDRLAECLGIVRALRAVAEIVDEIGWRQAELYVCAQSALRYVRSVAVAVASECQGAIPNQNLTRRQ